MKIINFIKESYNSISPLVNDSIRVAVTSIETIGRASRDMLDCFSYETSIHAARSCINLFKAYYKYSNDSYEIMNSMLDDKNKKDEILLTSKMLISDKYKKIKKEFNNYKMHEVKLGKDKNCNEIKLLEKEFDECYDKIISNENFVMVELIDDLIENDIKRILR